MPSLLPRFASRFCATVPYFCSFHFSSPKCQVNPRNRLPPKTIIAAPLIVVLETSHHRASRLFVPMQQSCAARSRTRRRTSISTTTTRSLHAMRTRHAPPIIPFHPQPFKPTAEPRLPRLGAVNIQASDKSTDGSAGHARSKSKCRLTIPCRNLGSTVASSFRVLIEMIEKLANRSRQHLRFSSCQQSSSKIASRDEIALSRPRRFGPRPDKILRTTANAFRESLERVKLGPS